MSFSLFPIAYAATEATPEHAAAGGLSTILLFAIMAAFIYFGMMRPQMKRAKEHRNLIAQLAKGDEVVTNGGILGKITKISDNYFTIAIAEGVEVVVQKNAIAASLPKGTIKNI